MRVAIFIVACIAACWTGSQTTFQRVVSSTTPSKSVLVDKTCHNIEEYVNGIPEAPDIDKECSESDSWGDRQWCEADQWRIYAGALRWKLSVAVAWCKP